MPLLYHGKKRDRLCIPKQHFNEVTFLPLRFSLPSAITAAFGYSDFREASVSCRSGFRERCLVLLFCVWHNYVRFHMKHLLLKVKITSYHWTPCIEDRQTALWGATTIGNAVKKWPEERKRARSSSFAAYCQRAVFLTLSSSRNRRYICAVLLWPNYMFHEH